MHPLSAASLQNSRSPSGGPRLACGWYETADAGPRFRAAEGDLRFDMAVVGAGFTGLACARRLAQLHPEASIALIEADRIAAANSGRNSGFLLSISFYDEAAPEHQQARTRLQAGGLAELTRVVAEQGIDCDWTPWGNLHGCVAETDELLLDKLAQQFRDCGIVPEDWPAEQIAEAIGTTRYRRGLFHPGTVMVQPVKLVRGLAATLPESVTVFERSPVTGIARHGRGFELAVAESRIGVERLFLCANGGIPALGFGSNRLLKVSTFAAMTRPLEVLDGPLATVAPFGVLPCLTGGATLRKTADNRLIVRQGGAFTPQGAPTNGDYAHFLEQARKTKAFYWPELEDLAFEWVWSGVMCLTRNNGHIFGEIEPGLFVAGFCNGAGNTMGTMSGKLLAEISAGLESDLLADQLHLPQPSPVPPEFLCRFFVRQRIAGAERRRASLYAAALARAD